MAIGQAMSLAQFMVWLGTQEMKHEYDRGRVIPHLVAMLGGAEPHHRIEANLVVALGNAFEDSPFVFRTSNQLIATVDGEIAYFPDAVLLDGEPVLIRYGTQHAAANPAVAFEIASPSTCRYDEGRKLDVYRSIPSMREVVLIESDAVRAVRHFRTEEGWDEEEIVGLAAILTVLGVPIPMAQLYRNVEFPG